MFGVRILLFVVAFLIVIAEFWAGAIATEPLQMAFAIVIGGTVIALLLSISIFLLARVQADHGPSAAGTPIQWIVLLVAGMFIAGVSFFMPGKLLPLLTGLQLCPAP